MKSVLSALFLLTVLQFPATVMAQSGEREPTLRESVDSAAARAADYLGDAALTARIKAALATESGLGPLQVGVTTTNGVVTLSGDVDNAAQRRLAERTAADVQGVVAVHNAMRVRGEAAANGQSQ